MSHRHFCDVMGHWFDCDGKALRRGNKEPSVCVCDTCGLPLEEGDHSQCKNRVKFVSCPAHRNSERRRMVLTEMDQASTSQKAAYAEFMKTRKGTLEHYQALESFISLLFPESDLHAIVPPQVLKPDGRPDGAGHRRTRSQLKKRFETRKKAPAAASR